MSDLIPENLESPSVDLPSFTIEGHSIVPTTTTASRKKNEVYDILTWVEHRRTGRRAAAISTSFGKWHYKWV